MVSLSLGSACDFVLKDSAASCETTVRLGSGDALLFGGPARHAMHAVTKIHAGTCPAQLRHERKSAFGRKDAVDYASPDGEFRLNLTWRHAPELRGQESEERFFHFGAATRSYLDAQKREGTDAARKEANDRRETRKRDKAHKRSLRERALETRGPSN